MKGLKRLSFSLQILTAIVFVFEMPFISAQESSSDASDADIEGVEFDESKESLLGDADQARKILSSRCAPCHGDEFQGHASMSFHNLETLTQDGLLVPNDPEGSLIFRRIRDGEMPEDEPLPSEEVEVIRKWIESGAEGVRGGSAETVRGFIGLADTYEAIQLDLMKLNRESRPYTRYFSMVNLHNDLRISESHLDATRVALSKMLNSVSHESTISIPVAIDANEAIFRIDLRDYGWNAHAWSDIERTYPYGLRSVARQDEDSLLPLDSINAEMGVSHTFLRLDWFVDTVARPHFYYRLLNLPKTVLELEHSLGVHADQNVLRYRVVQAGFATSGVSNGNRMVQRHPSRNGMYWKSFDFSDDSITGNLFQRPLTVPENPSEERFVMEFDGGEMIFTLANGLQGYYLSDAQGNRLDRGPIEVVRDERRTGGTAEVVNAISCLNCHARGIINFKDTVREGHVLSGHLARRVEQLYPENQVLEKFIQDDSARFIEAMRKVTGKWGEFEKYSNPTDEPIGIVVRRYQQDLDLKTAAAELGVSEEILSTGISGNNNLIRAGLRPLTKNARIKRSYWSDRTSLLSPMQTTARTLKIATPAN